MRTLFSTMLAVVAVLFLGMAPSEAQIKLRAGNVLPPTSDQGQASEFFAKPAAGGRMTRPICSTRARSTA